MSLKRYRLPLIFAVLFALWLFFGRDFLTRVLNNGETQVINGIPDGVSGRLLFTQGRDGLWQVDLANGERTEWWNMPENAYVSGLTASPDGNSIVIAYEPQMPDESPTSSTDLYLLSDPPTQATPIIEREILSEVYEHPVWSPDGDWLYFAHYVLQMDENGGVQGFTQTVERLPSENFDAQPQVVIDNAVELSIADDMSAVTYVYFDPQTYAYSLRVADVDGENAREILPGNLFESLSSPHFSPDNTTVYFGASGSLDATTADLPSVQAHGAPWDIWQVDVASGDYARLTNLGIDGPDLAWSPDGQFLAFVALEGVYIYDMSANKLYRVADSTSEGEIIWLTG